MPPPPESVPIPQPQPGWFFGHLNQIDKNKPIQGFMRLAEELGPIYQLEVMGRRLVMVSSQELVHELSDESRFQKQLSLALKNIRALAGDGLFTAYNDEPNWGKAHRLLMPAFGPLGVRQMFDGMGDIADQMFTKWRRFGEQSVIDVADNMTRLTLDTIALCGFNYRFNSFYQPESHPFVSAMVGALSQAGAMSRRPAFLNRLLYKQQKQFAKDIAYLRKISEQLVNERRKLGAENSPKDLLGIMLQGIDSVTGERLSDENVGHQMVTFLIAGHETTSGLLSFATHLLLKHPQVMAHLQAEIDAVVGAQALQVDHLPQLRYTEQVLFETLRLWPTAPAYTLKATTPTLLGGRYAINPEDVIFVLLPSLHRDPQVWGEDAQAFKPERFAPQALKQIPPNAWKPFGNGARACIGRPFALQEATLVLAKMVQQFDIEAVDPDYNLQVAETLTLKPNGLLIRAKPRHPAARPGSTSQPAMPVAQALSPEPMAKSTERPQLKILYGSNTGSCQAFAERIVQAATQQGYDAQLQTLDEASAEWTFDGPPTDATCPVVIVTASYEGHPTENAKEFMDWLSLQGTGSLSGLHYCVFGCGNRQWAQTYQAIPTRIDQSLFDAGAQRFRPRGQADANGHFEADFEAWLPGLWPALRALDADATTPAEVGV